MRSLGSMGLFDTPSHIYSLSQLKHDKTFERIEVALQFEIGQIGS